MPDIDKPAVDNTAAELSSLRQQRGTVKRNITNLVGKIEREGNDIDETIMQCRLAILESYFKEVTFLQGQIERLDPTDLSRSDLEESYISGKSKLMHFLNDKHPASAIQNTSQLLLPPTQTHSRLPSLKLPQFSGKYSDYKKFISSFKNMVHNDASISKIDKFNYLLLCLSGPALAVVQAYHVTEANYDQALKSLQERYDNDVLIFLEHIHSIFEIPSMENNDAASLRHIIDTMSALRGSLLSLGGASDVMNAILIHIVLMKLDNQSKIAYDEKIDFASLPNWTDAYKILSRRCQFLECRPNTEASSSKPPAGKAKENTKKSSLLAATSKCEVCQGEEHYLGKCPEFKGWSITKRSEYIKKTGRCLNCFRKGHVMAKCQSKSRCRVCQQSHHSMLHEYKPENTLAVSTDASKSAATTNVINVSHTALLARSVKVSILPTALILIRDSFGIYQPIRTLLDSCSEVNFMTSDAAQRLHLKLNRTIQSISGIGDVKSESKYCTATTIKSRISSFERHATFLISKQISTMHPAQNIDISTWKIPSTIELADPCFQESQHVDLLLSTDIFFDLLEGGKISLGQGMPFLINTSFGWIIGGGIETHLDSSVAACNIATIDENLDEVLPRFWNIEEYVPHSSSFSDEEAACEQHFMENVSLRSDGRIQVRLPFKESPASLGNSYNHALKRFLALERRLGKDDELNQLYCDFMTEYENLGHMTKMKQCHAETPHYVIPHHSVMKPESETTKLRVVFDASAATTSNKSLNDILMIGPTIQQDLITTLLGFRLHRFALTADISKMYRQFLIAESDRKFQKILWRPRNDMDLNIYQLNTVTYGTSSAPFLAIRCLYYIADLYESEFPLGAKVLRQDMYVDDVLTGADNFETIERVKTEVTAILAKCKLELAKWNCNNTNLFDAGSEEYLIKTNEQYSTKALGLIWKPIEDIFSFSFTLENVQRDTKRTTLSTIAKIHDLLGILSPIVVRCKILMQELWIKGLDWDDELTDSLTVSWKRLKEDLRRLDTIKFPRYVLTSTTSKCQVHGFADASERAYGCCIYIRVQKNSTFKATLLIAKSKVAPIKVQSLPRLKLCAALLLCRTWKKFEDKLIKFTNDIVFWTDSKIVLQWLKSHSSTLQCFVANRVSELQQNTQKVSWRHVRSKDNPADIVSRGCTVSELETNMWFNGPDFLTHDSVNWPERLYNLDIDPECLELRKRALNCTTKPTSVIANVIEDCSSYLRIMHRISFLYRPNSRKVGYTTLHISSDEMENTFLKILEDIQNHYFADVITCLRNNQPVKASLQKLTPFIHVMRADTRNISLVRVGGRLANAPIPFDARFPVLVPKESRFVQRYIEHVHRINLHAGAKILIGIIRQKIWIINARDIVRRVIRNCVHSFHYKPRLWQQIMGSLPADRLRAVRPFLVSGVDLCGPFFTTFRIRGKPPYKTYLAIYICFATKAIHAELVSDLSTNAFLLSLKRFISRRGMPLRIYCDNATNFAGANSKLKAFTSKPAAADILTFCSSRGFEFSFIPPRAPHFGGLWESTVKSMKTLLMKNLSQAYLTYEELLTVVVEAEAILNCRPIAASDDPNDGEALTPAHMLIGESLKTFPERDVVCNNISNLERYQRVTYLKQQFWKLWSRDYILSLQQRSKWFQPERNIQVGQLVLIHEDNTPPQQWVTARIIKTFPGSDGNIRVVDLQTPKGILRRPIHKLAPLPIEKLSETESFQRGEDVEAEN